MLIWRLVLLGVLFADEHMTLLQLIGLAVILTSVLLINLAKYRNEQKNNGVAVSNKVFMKKATV